MRYITVLSLFFVLFVCGCEEQMQQGNNNGSPAVSVQKTCLFVPAKIKFNQLTEFKDAGQITAYVDVLDQFSSRIKSSAVWRFELYGYVPRSAESKGARIHLWDDIELADARKNNDSWQDYLRCYKFDLDIVDLSLAADKTYILQAICFTPQGRRITDSIELKM